MLYIAVSLPKTLSGGSIKLHTDSGCTSRLVIKRQIFEGPKNTGRQCPHVCSSHRGSLAGGDGVGVHMHGRQHREELQIWLARGRGGTQLGG